MPPTRQVTNTTEDARSTGANRRSACSAWKWRCLLGNRSHSVCVLLLCCYVCCVVPTLCVRCPGLVRLPRWQLQRHAATHERGAVSTSVRTRCHRWARADTCTGHLLHLSLAPRPVAPSLQANEVRCLSQSTLLFWQHTVPRVDERAAPRTSRGICAQAPMLREGTVGQETTSKQQSTDGDGERK